MKLKSLERLYLGKLLKKKFAVKLDVDKQL